MLLAARTHTLEIISRTARLSEMRRAQSVPASMASMATQKQIPKHELRKLKIKVAKLREQGHIVYTDEEVANEGWTLEAVNPQSCGGLHVEKEERARIQTSFNVYPTTRSILGRRLKSLYSHRSLLAFDFSWRRSSKRAGTAAWPVCRWSLPLFARKVRGHRNSS